MVWLVIGGSGGGGGPAVTGAFEYSTKLSSYITPADPPLEDQDLILLLQDRSATRINATQEDVTKQPVADDDEQPGIYVVRVAADQHLTIMPTDTVDTYIIAVAGLVSGASRTILSRDTVELGTTKAAYELLVEGDLL